ncbi:MAG: class I SAM-dependent methyltransferase [Armatimonadota bacterium]
MVSQAQEYWDSRYQVDGFIWGTSPSRTALHALEVFKAHGVNSVLVPGSGYGRNTLVFSSAGMDVTGIEISPTACEIAAKHDPKTRVYQGSVTSMVFPVAPYDALYCFNVLHLMRAADRESFIDWVKSQIKGGGILYFTVFSEQESTFGKGEESEPNTFESKPGRPVHYFTDDDLREHFRDFQIIETGLVDDPEDHDGAPHVHKLRYIIVEK